MSTVTYCPNCGTKRYQTANYCFNCGFNFTELKNDVSAEEDIAQGLEKEEISKSLFIPKDDFIEIRESLNKRGEKIEAISKTEDKFKYIVLTEDKQILEIEVGGFRTELKELDSEPDKYSWYYSFHFNSSDDNQQKNSKLEDSKPEKRINPKALTGFIVGIVSVFLNFLILPQIIAIVFGVIGLNEVNEKKESGKGLAITGMILGFVYLLVSLANANL